MKFSFLKRMLGWRTLGSAAVLMNLAPVAADPILDANSARVSFQARVVDDNGVPLPGPTVDFAFQLYDGGGTAIGSPISVDDVPIDGGLVNTWIPLAPGDFDGTARQIGLSVNGGAELSPRMPLVAVPYAYRVHRVASAELDDSIDLGEPNENGSLAIYGGQANPTFAVDAAQNIVSLLSDDETGSVSIIAENGGGFVSALRNSQVRTLMDGSQGNIWASSTINVGLIATDFSDNTAYGSLQFGSSFGGRLLTWDRTKELSVVIGSSAGADAGGLMQLYRGGTGGLTVEIDGEDGNGAGRALWRDSESDTTVVVSGQDHRIYTYGADDNEHARLGGAASGNLQLRGGGPTNPLTVNLNAGGGGALDLYDAPGTDLGLRLEGGTSSSGGRLRVYNAGSQSTVDIQGNANGNGDGRITIREGSQDSVILDADVHRIQIFDPTGTETLRLWGNGAGGGGGVSVRNDSGAVTAELDGDENASNSATLRLSQGDGTTVFTLNADTREFTIRGGSVLAQNDAGQNTAELRGDASNSGVLNLRRADGTLGVRARATEGTGSELNLYDETGATRIQLDTDWNGNGNSRLVVDEVQILGGADLSEQFDVSEGNGPAEPGMVVSIDPDRPGKLRVSSTAHDRTVAGVISGGGGVKTGLYMGQKDSEADGRLPVALTGRVYCRVDASFGAVRPGDLLTTSDTPGHAMKVADPQAAYGAIIGKAMTGLDSGRGLVLVLVNLH